MSADPIARLVHAFGKLPGIGEKTATRLAFYVLRSESALAEELAQALRDVRSRIQLCGVCCALTEIQPCLVCRDPGRRDDVICVVASPQDQLAVERSGCFRGRFHILHGILQPLEGIGPAELHVSELLQRVRGRSEMEIIVATSPSTEGETTALYLARLLKPLGVKVSRIATGMPMGGELEYADRVTLARAFDGRRDL